jgi:hypothetical protein
MANDGPNVKPVYSWTAEQIIEIGKQLNRLDQRFDRMERVANLQWVYGIGFGFVAIGSGLIPSGASLKAQEMSYGSGILIGGAISFCVGLAMMVGCYLVLRCETRQNSAETD